MKRTAAVEQKHLMQPMKAIYLQLNPCSISARWGLERHKYNMHQLNEWRVDGATNHIHTTKSTPEYLVQSSSDLRPCCLLLQTYTSFPRQQSSEQQMHLEKNVQIHSSDLWFSTILLSFNICKWHQSTIFVVTTAQLTFQNMLSPACSSMAPSNAESKNTYKAQLHD